MKEIYPRMAVGMSTSKRLSWPKGRCSGILSACESISSSCFGIKEGQKAIDEFYGNKM